MSNLTVINHNGQFAIDSREVAEMVQIRHSDLLEKITGYEKYLLNGKFRSVDFFIPNTYQDSTGRTLPCYLLTRKGCDMVANKMTGEKGVLFTAAYVTKFEEMEKAIKAEVKPLLVNKQKEIEARYNNSLARKAAVLLKIANSPDVNPRYRQVLQAQASEIVAGRQLLPLPEAEQRTYTAEEIGKMLGVSANMVGRLAKQHNLKTEQYGKWYHDKSKYSCKEVETFRYYENVIPVLQSKLEGGEKQ
jgi:Rha family phage regulatory protein